MTVFILGIIFFPLLRQNAVSTIPDAHALEGSHSGQEKLELALCQLWGFPIVFGKSFHIVLCLTLDSFLTYSGRNLHGDLQIPVGLSTLSLPWNSGLKTLAALASLDSQPCLKSGCPLGSTQVPPFRAMAWQHSLCSKQGLTSFISQLSGIKAVNCLCLVP